MREECSGTINDKQHSVQCLLRTEYAHKMTNKEIAQASGVDEKTVRNYRERRELIVNYDLLPEIRVNKQGWRRPTKYKKRKPKKPGKAPSVLKTYQPVSCWLQTDGKERGRLTACPRSPGGRPLGFAPPPALTPPHRRNAWAGFPVASQGQTGEAVWLRNACDTPPSRWFIPLGTLCLR